MPLLLQSTSIHQPTSCIFTFFRESQPVASSTASLEESCWPFSPTTKDDDNPTIHYLERQKKKKKKKKTPLS